MFNISFPLPYAVISLFLCLGGCSDVNYAVRGEGAQEPAAGSWFRQRTEMLSRDLSALSADVSGQEAREVAEAAISFSADLAEQYRLVRPPVFHNLLVNLGIKDRGLCTHWTEDLLKRLRSLGLKSLRLHWGVAEPASLFGLQHSSVIITARGQTFEQGLVLDPWRNSGELYWAVVRDDIYVWKPEKL
jgi:hypothetical protein